MLARSAAAGLIVGYQRYLSPWKGYCCAYRAAHGGPSCSEFARRLVLRSGVAQMLRLMPARFARCHQAALALSAMHDPELDESGPEHSNDSVASTLPKDCDPAFQEMSCHCCCSMFESDLS